MLREFRSTAKGLPDLLNYCMMIGEGVALLKDGAFCAGWTYRGPDLNSAENSDIEFLSSCFNNVLCHLGNGWMIHNDMTRRSSVGYPESSMCFFPDPVSRMIDEERRLQYEAEKVHFESTYTLMLTYLPPTDMDDKVSRLFIRGHDKTAINWHNLLKQFEEKIVAIENILSKLLFLKRADSDALLTICHSAITGLHYPIKMSKIPVYLDTVLGTQDLIAGLQPKIGSHYLRMIALDGFPQYSEPGLLKVLDQLPIAFRWSNRFIVLDPHTAAIELKKYRRNWFQKRHGLMGLIKEVMMGEEGTTTLSRDALDMTHDAEDAIQEAESGLVRYGYYTSVIVLYEENQAVLDESTKLLYQELCNRGFSLRTETMNAMEAYLGSLPGHGYHNIRRPLLHSLNFANLIPLTSVWPGLTKNPCAYYPENSPPLLYAATEGSTPYRFNLHVGDVAHTAIFGDTGAGKSTLILTLCTQFFRYQDAQVFLFDKGYSGYVLCKAMGGEHYDIGSSSQGPAFYPLAHIDQADELNWACEWIEACLTLNHFTVTHQHRNAIRQGLIRLSHSESRTLTELQSAIQDKDIQRALEFYTLAGEMGSILDATHDDLRHARFQVFEMEHVLQKGPERFVPTVLYLFHQIKKRLNEGKPTLIFLEEGRNLLSGNFGKQLDEWLLELRKKNAGLVFLTQDISHVLRSEHKENLFNNCPTQIFLPNVHADNDINYPNYRGIGLTEKQIHIIKSAIPKKHYYVSSRLGSRLIDLGLGKLALSFVGVDGGKNRARVDELINQYGSRWVYHWLKEKGLPEWAHYWETLVSQQGIAQPFNEVST